MGYANPYNLNKMLCQEIRMIGQLLFLHWLVLLYSIYLIFFKRKTMARIKIRRRFIVQDIKEKR